MRIFRILYGIVLTLIVFVSAFGMIHARANENGVLIRYVGDETCEVCHSSSSIGKQFQIWQRSPHARAYRDLESPEGMTIARKLNIANPQKNPRCLSCHTTAAGTHLPNIISTFRPKDGVQCESCHGPGEDYAHYSVMIDPVKSSKAGLTIHPGEKTCITCHNSSSPTFKEFDYQRALAQIAHPIPKK
ncbi:MAG: multiheme c-type cytochrome [Nitrospiraceae bacterium]|nr:multiheme c-type cytochrome [Nitrospiraceae bacterium]